MKTKIFSALGLLFLSLQWVAFTRPTDKVSEELIKTFRSSFPDASQVNWREDEEHCFVHFTQGSVISEIEYDQDGGFLSARRYYKNPDLLPLNVFWKLHSRFPDKSIFSITESSLPTGTTYHVKMEDQKGFITVKADEDGSLTVTEKFRKQTE